MIKLIVTFVFYREHLILGNNVVITFQSNIAQNNTKDTSNEIIFINMG
jgi:hypothetical protein